MKPVSHERTSYIQSELVGDEDRVVIDCAILECLLQEDIFEKLISWTGKPITGEMIDNLCRDVLPKPLCYTTIQINMKRGDEDEMEAMRLL